MTVRLGLALVLVLAAVALAAADAPAQEAAKLPPAASSLARCLQNSDRLSVVMLIDESRSLKGTDRTNQRIDGLKAALTGLIRLAEPPAGAAAPHVEVQFAGFANRVQPPPGRGEWLDVSSATLPDLQRKADAFAERKKGRDTDYATALAGARRILVARSASIDAAEGVAPCEALVWFTDGRYQIDDRTDAEGRRLPRTVPYAPGIRIDRPKGGKRAVAAGKRFLCQPGGEMDRFVNDGIVKFTVALSSRLKPDEAALLGAITTGAADGERCGSELSPESGHYLETENSGDLFFLFSSLFSASPPPKEGLFCVPDPCPEGRRAFEAVPGATRFLIHATTGAEGIQLHLAGPTGGPKVLLHGGPGQLDFPGTNVVQRWVSPRAVEVEGTFDPGDRAWQGGWTFAFVAPSGVDRGAKPLYTLQLLTDLAASPAGVQQVTLGEPTRLKFRLVDRRGALVRTGPLLRAATLHATVTDPTTRRSVELPLRGPAADGTFEGSVTLPARSQAAYVFVDVDPSFATPDGTPLVGPHRSFRLSTQAPGFATIAPQRLELPRLKGKGSTKGTLTIRGSKLADGCVWVGTPKLGGRGAGGLDMRVVPPATSRASCVRVPRSATRRLTVEFKASDQAAGTVRGALPVNLTSTSAEGPRIVSLETSFRRALDPDTGTKVAVFVGLILAGVLIPLVLLYLLNRHGARFTAPQRVVALTRDVRLHPGRSLESRNDEPLEARRSDFMALSREGQERRERELAVDGVTLQAVPSKVRATPSWNPKDLLVDLFTGPYGVASADGQPIAAGGAKDLREWRAGATHEVPLALPGTWLFYPAGSSDGDGWDEPSPAAEPWDQPGGRGSQAARSAPSAIDGTLVLLLGDVETDPRAGDALLAQARRSLVLEPAERWRGPRDSSGDGDDRNGGSSRSIRNRLGGLLTRRRAQEEPPVNPWKPGDEPPDGWAVKRRDEGHF
jgi:hypothetical protein